jgi:hypothetical protein
VLKRRAAEIKVVERISNFGGAEKFGEFKEKHSLETHV